MTRTYPSNYDKPNTPRLAIRLLFLPSSSPPTLCVPPPCAVPSVVVPYFVVDMLVGVSCREREERGLENSKRREDGACCAYRVYEAGCIKRVKMEHLTRPSPSLSLSCASIAYTTA